MLRERSSIITLFVEHHRYSIFKMQSVLILVAFFYLSLFTQSVCIKSIYSRNFRWSAKGEVILLCSWSTLYIAFLKYKVSWFYSFYFNLSLFTQIACVKVSLCWNVRCSAKATLILLLSQTILYRDFSFLFWFASTNPKCMCKGNLLLRF